MSKNYHDSTDFGSMNDSQVGLYVGGSSRSLSGLVDDIIKEDDDASTVDGEEDTM